MRFLKNRPANNAKHSPFLVLFFLIILFTSCRKADSLKQINAGNASSLQKASSDKPNIILILGDDVGYEIPTVNGGQSYSTPNIDNMAQTGMRFTQCHATPLCSPSRFMLLTGKYNFRNYNVWGIMPDTNKTIATMLRDAGYKTTVAGKWQLGGGDTAIHALGFDDYMVWNPFTGEAGEVQGHGSRYKDPVIYKDSAFIKGAQTKGKYGDDIFTNYINKFIDSNKTNPFFIYYPICLVHYPFGPTPNDPEFATWNPKTSFPDPKFFPSMVNYMDIEVGKIIDEVNAAGIANNTLVIYVGDNGTDQRITSLFNGQEIQGAKSQTIEYGEHVPLLMWWQGKILGGSTNDDLIDFTDFLPTLADVAGIPLPTTYGPLDGVSFYPRLTGDPGTPRNWIFCHYYPNQDSTSRKHARWVQDKNYKLYDSTGRFYHYSIDLYEKTPLKTFQMTKQEQQIRANFQAILSTMHN